jgi:hypothetical protein
MENQELILLEIDELNRSQMTDLKLSQTLESFIEHVAKTGVYLFPWHAIRKLYVIKMQTVIDHFNQTSNMDGLLPIPNFENIKFNQLRERLTERMHSFTRHVSDCARRQVFRTYISFCHQKVHHLQSNA